MTYTVNFTDKSKEAIILEDDDIFSSLGITLFGRNRLSYGEEMQENLLHLLESFSAPESTVTPNTPDTTKVFNSVLTGPIEGRLWYNSTKKTINYFNDTIWQPLANRDDLAANWGVISDGGTLPKPISKITGKMFDYDECVWIVSPFILPEVVDGFNCTTDDNAVVNMKYKAGNTQISGVANYMIVGLSGNRTERQQTISYALTNASTGTVISSSTALAAQCVPLINGDLAGMDCSGVTAGCGIGNCAPRTGVNFKLTLSGGVAPYTATIVNITRNEINTECVSFGFDSAAAMIHASASTSANAPLANLGANTFGPLSILSECGTSSIPITGVITIAVTDSAGHTRNVFVNYSSSRLYPSNPVNDAPYNTLTCGTTADSIPRMVAIGSPNYLYVQDSLNSAPASTSYYMSRTFNVATTGTYTLKMYNDDTGWVYVDGVLVYNGGTTLPCNSVPLQAQFTMGAGTHQILVQYENIPANSPAYVAFAIYDPSGNLYYTSNKSGWLALTSTSGITS